MTIWNPVFRLSFDSESGRKVLESEDGLTEAVSLGWGVSGNYPLPTLEQAKRHIQAWQDGHPTKPEWHEADCDCDSCDLR